MQFVWRDGISLWDDFLTCVEIFAILQIQICKTELIYYIFLKTPCSSYDLWHREFFILYSLRCELKLYIQHVRRYGWLRLIWESGSDIFLISFIHQEVDIIGNTTTHSTLCFNNTYFDLLPWIYNIFTRRFFFFRLITLIQWN